MAVTVEQRDLRAAVARVKPAYHRSAPVLALTAEANELCVTGAADYADELRIATLCPCTDGDLDNVLVPMRALAAVIAATPKDRTIRFDYDGERLRIVSGSGMVTIPDPGFVPSPTATLLPARKVGRPDDPSEWKVTRRSLGAMRHALVAVDTDDCRPVLNNIQVSPDGSVVSTDSYRLAHMTTDDPPPEEILFGRRAIAAIPDETDEILVSYATDWIEMACDSGTTITHRPISWGGHVPYPNWQAFVVDSWPTVIGFDRDEMLTQLRVASALTDWECMTLVAAEGQIELLGKCEGIEWSSTLDAVRRGRELRIGFNPDYLADGVRSIGTPRVDLAMTDNLKPVTLMDPEDTRRYVLMPVRIG